MKPTSLPELPKPTMTLKSAIKLKPLFLYMIYYRTNPQTSLQSYQTGTWMGEFTPENKTTVTGRIAFDVESGSNVSNAEILNSDPGF